MKIVQKIQLKIVIFTALKICCLLHGRVFVMDHALYDLKYIEGSPNSNRSIIFKKSFDKKKCIRRCLREMEPFFSVFGCQVFITIKL